MDSHGDIYDTSGIKSKHVGSVSFDGYVYDLRSIEPRRIGYVTSDGYIHDTRNIETRCVGVVDFQGYISDFRDITHKKVAQIYPPMTLMAECIPAVILLIGVLFVLAMRHLAGSVALFLVETWETRKSKPA